MSVPAMHNWPTNGHLIADVAKLYDFGDHVLDATYGRGNFWTEYRPDPLVTNDINRDTDSDHCFDFRDMPFADHAFDTVVFDPPYKLNGTPALGDFDHRYGISQPTTWQDRMQLILDGFAECARLTKPGGLILVKCQDQVCSGKVRWQTYEVTKKAESLGIRLVDRFDMLGGTRPQPEGRTQRHAYGRGSTLLVFQP